MSLELRGKREGVSPLPAFCFLVLAAMACSRPAPTPSVTAFVGATVFDGTGRPPVRDAVILVRDGRITEIGAGDAVSIPVGARWVGLGGKWVIPGLIDGHVHVDRWAMSRYLAYGVTSVRDVGNDMDSVVAWRAEVGAGTVLGPRLFISGAQIDGVPAIWGSSTELHGPDEAKAAVAARAAVDVSQIKLYVHTTLPLMEAVVREARARGIPVTAHLGRVDAVSAAKAGVGAIEHLSGVVEATVRDRAPYVAAHEKFFDGWKAFLRGWAGLDSASLERTAEALIKTGLTIVPTLVQSETYAHLNDAAYAHGLDVAGVPAGIQAGWDMPDLLRRAAISDADFATFRRSRTREDLFVRRYRALGGKVVAGSDSPNQLLAPGASLHHELALLVKAGLSPSDAIVSATSAAATLLQADSIGVLAPGNVADFVVLSADPLADIANAGRIELVVSAGRRYPAAELRKDW